MHCRIFLRNRRVLAALSCLLALASPLLPSRSSAIGGPVPPAGGPNATPPYRSTRTDNKVLVIPVQFSGGATNPLTQAAAVTAMDEMDTWLRQASYGSCGFSSKVSTTVLTLPNPKSYYTAQGFGTLLNDARAAALAANAAWNTANFDFDVVVSESGTLTNAGIANQRTKGMWLPNGDSEPFPKSSFAHEFGHNLGLNHAGLWIRPNGSSNPLDAAGTFQDYGSLFDPVGLAGYPCHYSAHYKYLLGWIPAANVVTVDSTTTTNVRIYAQDGGALNPARAYAIRIPASVSDATTPGGRDYWLDTRTIFNAGIAPANKDGLVVQWGDQVGSPQGSCLIDTHPNSIAPNNAINDFADAVLGIGTTFADPWNAPAGSNRITVTPVSSGGSGADKWVEVAITTPNADLSALAFSAGALSPAFSPITPGYSITALGATTTTVTPTAAAGATVQVRLNGGSFSTVTSGVTGSPLTLTGGPNLIDVKVTNGGWTKTYSTTINTMLQVPAVAASLGAIPDGPGFSGVEGSPRDVQFNVSGLSGSLSNIAVNFTLSPAHTWGSDVVVKLIAPNGTTTHTVLSLVGMDNGTDLAGPYTFADDAAGPLSAAMTGSSAASGRYRTQGNSSTVTTMLPVFSGLSGAALNGTWTLRFTDRFNGDTGTVGAANLFLATNVVASTATVTTATQSGVTSSSATLGGNVTADGGASVTDRGIVWATTATPTTSNNKVTNGSGTGSFSGTVSGFPASTLIYVRAYATNSAGTAYGSQISFTTSGPVLSSNANLAALGSSAGSLSPAFSSGVISYTISVPNATASATVTSTVADATATLAVRVNGGSYAGVASGAVSSALALNVGSNSIDVRVTAQDGSTIKIYTITVTRDAPAAGGDTVAGSNLGAIPDFDTNGRDIPFVVSGRSGTVNSASVQLAFDPAHTFLGDLLIILVAPDNTTADLFRRTETNLPCNAAGPYTFSDAGSVSFQTAATGLDDNAAVPSGTYRAASAQVIVNLNTVFGGKAPNGTWHLRVFDLGQLDTGSVSQASLTLTTTGGTGTGLTAAKVAIEHGLDGQMIVTLTGATPNTSYNVKRSTDLEHWNLFQTIQTNGSGSATVTDFEPPAGQGGFYRFETP